MFCETDVRYRNSETASVVSLAVRALSDAFAEGQRLRDDERDWLQDVTEVGRIKLSPRIDNVGAEIPSGFGSMAVHVLEGKGAL